VILSIQFLLDEVEKKISEKDQSSLSLTLDKLTEHVFKYLRDNTKATELSSSGTYETALPDDIETFK
jgi:hypothetical protein